MYINKQPFNVKRYSSGELKLLKEDLDKYIYYQSVEILYNGKISFFELLLILDYYISNKVKVNLILAYLPYQRMDHKNTHEVATMQNVANILNGLKLNSLTICEPHSSVQDFNNVKTFSYVEWLKDRVLEKIGISEDDNIIFTDKGGQSRYSQLFKDSVYFNKQRDKQTGLICSHQIVGDIKQGKKALIIDDIISTGDTLVGVVEKLTELNITEIYILSGHIENNKYNKRLIENKNVKGIFSTNSLKKKSNNKKLKLYNVKEIIYGY